MATSPLHGLWLAAFLTVTATQGLATEPDTAEPPPDYEAITAADPEIPSDELALLVKPITADNLLVEADAWLALVQAKTLETSQAELAVKHKNKTIAKAEEVQDSLEETQDILEDVKEASSGVGDAGNPGAAQKAKELARQAAATIDDTSAAIDEAVETSRDVAGDENVQQALNSATQPEADALSESAHSARRATAKVSDAAARTANASESGEGKEAERLAAKTQRAVDQAKDALVDTSSAVDDAAEVKIDQIETKALDESAKAVAALAEGEQDDKKEILSSVNELKAQRTALIDRLNVVVDELSLKLGTSIDGQEHEKVLPYRLYAAAVGDVKIDVSDTQALYSNVVGWMRSDAGGLRLARNLGKFLLAVSGFWLLGIVVGKIVDKALRMTRITVELMRSVIVRTVRRGIMLVGIIVGLAAMEINVGPILAVVGAAGFVVAFALQNTLSNFASGIMIMIYRPYDVGDMINVGGVTGQARSMNLVTTTIATPDNQLLIIPNNAVWGNTITNITGSETRRVDMIFRISYQDDIEAALRILQEITHEHPLVLEDPEPVIAVQELGEFSVNFVCRPWSKTEDYWQVFREITRSVKERFEQAGLTTPSIPLQYAHKLPAAPSEKGLLESG